MMLDDEHKIVIAVMPEKDMVDLHFSLGMAIAWGWRSAMILVFGHLETPF